MILAIDIGNTNIVLGCCDKQKIHFTERLSTDVKKTELEYAISFKNVLEMYGIDPKTLEGGIISSVVPSVTSVTRSAAEKIIGKPVKVVAPGMKTGFSINIDNPAQLGSDLVVDAAAGIAEYPLPLVIFDMGTATTVSVIDQNKKYLGGMIIPGVRISLDSLISGTSQLPKISLDAPKKVIGTNTVDCMKSGILYGNAACMDGIVDRIEDDLGAKVTAVATGGLAKFIIPYCKRNIILDDELLLKGLMIINEKNK